MWFADLGVERALASCGTGPRRKHLGRGREGGSAMVRIAVGYRCEPPHNATLVVRSSVWLAVVMLP